MRAEPTSDEIHALTPDQLVNKLWDKRIRNDVQRALIGGLGACETRHLIMPPAVRAAVIGGLAHWSPKVRWWCLQLIDHHGDEHCLPHVVPLLHDPVQRVRKIARHTLECERCKRSPEAIDLGRRLLTNSLPDSANSPYESNVNLSKA